MLNWQIYLSETLNVYIQPIRKWVKCNRDKNVKMMFENVVF